MPFYGTSTLLVQNRPYDYIAAELVHKINRRFHSALPRQHRALCSRRTSRRRSASSCYYRTASQVNELLIERNWNWVNKPDGVDVSSAI